MEPISPELAFKVIGLCLAGYFGKRLATQAKRVEALRKGQILAYWCGSASAAYVLKPRTIVVVCS